MVDSEINDSEMIQSELIQSEMTGSKKGFLNGWLSSPMAFMILFSTLAFGFFFIADRHNTKIATLDNFVQDIEDQESWSSSGSVDRQVAFLGCAALGMLSLVLGKRQTFRLNLPVILIAIYVLWAGASYTWSIDRAVTAKRYILMLCCIIGCFGFSRFVRVRDVVLMTVIVTLALAATGIGLEIFFGEFKPWVSDYRFAGTLHPNLQSLNLGMGCIAAYTMTKIEPKSKLLFFGLFGVLFVALVMTKCRSATLTVPVVIGIIWFISQPTKFILAWGIAGIWLFSSVALLCLVAGFDPISEYQEVLLLGRGEETGSSLTGRLPLWEDLFEYIGFRPMKGYGYAAFWTNRHINDIAASQEWTISEAHSSYIEATLQLGIIGAIIMTLAAITTFFHAAITFRRTLRPEYLFIVGGVFLAMVRGFTEVGMSRPTGGLAFLFLALAAHSWHKPTKLIDRNKRVDHDS